MHGTVLSYLLVALLGFLSGVVSMSELGRNYWRRKYRGGLEEVLRMRENFENSRVSGD